MRDTTIIYRSFYEAIKTLSKEDQANVWEAVFEYSLNMKEIELQGVANTIFLLMKPNLEANIKRYNNGKKAKHKQKVSKTEARGKQEVSKDEANKDKDKDKDKDIIKDKGAIIENEKFKLFWESYPKKKSKGDAEKAWNKIKPKNELIEKIMQSLLAQKKSSDWLKEGGQFIPYPASWLNSKGWENEEVSGLSMKKELPEKPSPDAEWDEKHQRWFIDHKKFYGT